MPTSQNSPRLSTAKEIALAFGGSAAASASGWHDFRCPAHDDKTASCGVKDERDGKLAVKCHAGCEREAILDAIEAKGLVVRERSNRRAERKSPEELFRDALQPHFPLTVTLRTHPSLGVTKLQKSNLKRLKQ